MALNEWLAIGGYLVGGGGLLGGGVAAFKLRPERAKLRAEASTLLTTQSIQMSAALAERLDRALARIDKLEANEDAQRDLLAAHHDWDREVMHELRSRQIPISDPPPLFRPAA